MPRSARYACGVVLVCCGVFAPREASAQAPLREIGRLKLSILGLTAAPESLVPVVPKNIASGVRVIVQGGGGPISIADLTRFLGVDVHVQADLSGPGLAGSLAIGRRAPGDPPCTDPLLLPLPALTTAGDYVLSNMRLMAGDQPVLDVTPARVPLRVIDQVLITSVKTRPLTLQEIRDKGIVLDRNDYLGFEFTLGVKLDSKAVSVQLPVVFDRLGVPVPLPLMGVGDLRRDDVAVPDLPPMIPFLLDLEQSVGAAPQLKLDDGRLVDVRIPALLVIPGNVGYLKQFFSADLFVANGAPSGTPLVVHGITGTITLPPGEDAVSDTADDPLALPATERGPQSATAPVRGLGPDQLPGTNDDADALTPGEQGQVEFLLRGEREGFHTITFDIAATLDGLATGPVRVTGKASGGVLVRNPFFDVSFAVPSVVRKGEHFTLGVTVSNVGQGIANDVQLGLDASLMSGLTLVGDATRHVDTIKAGDARTLTYEFVSERTGQAVATYIHFDPDASAGGEVTFTVGIGERGVPLSPDTFVLPAVADTLPPSLVDAALRVLGQAWSIANAPPGTLAATVARTTKSGVTRKAQALAEAGLRVTLGEPVAAAVRDLGLDFYGATGRLDTGFDQLLRQTDAGAAFARVLGDALVDPVSAAGGVAGYQRDLAQLLASGPDVVSFGVTAPASLTVSLTDAANGAVARTIGDAAASLGGDVASAALVPIGSASLLGLIAAPATGPYTLTLTAPADTTVDLALALPRGDGTVARVATGSVALAAGRPARVTIDVSNADGLALEQDRDGDGVFETSTALAAQTLTAEGPRLVSATVVGPELVAGASDRGFSLAVLFDRPVDAASAGVLDHYSIPANSVLNAAPQLSGRLVFASLAEPEGPYVPSTVLVHGIADARGAEGPAATVSLAARLALPGAVINGHVFHADGTPVASANVVYTASPPIAVEDPSRGALAAVATDGRGQFQFRYVITDPITDDPWVVVAQDPSNGSVRWVSGYVRAPGEQVIVDIATPGVGTVTGIVRDLNGHAVGGAAVSVISLTDPQLGARAVTDGDGRYTAYGVAAGALSVQAVAGASLGRSSGRLDRAGTTAVVNVTMDGGVVSIAGTVRRVENGVTLPVAGANVVFLVQSQPGSDSYVAVAFVPTDGSGRYGFDGMPAGGYRVAVTLDSRDSGSVSGVAVANDHLTNKDILIEVANRAHVRGFVRLPNGQSPTGAQIVVSVDGRGVLMAADGSFDIAGVPVMPGVSRTVNAWMQDGTRTASAKIVVNDTQPVAVTLTLSGLGSAQFTVFDAAGQPLAGQPVALVVACSLACGCSTAIGVSDAAGIVTFDGLKLGAVSARALRTLSTYVDVAAGNAPVPGDGQTGFGVLRFAGAGSVTGTVLQPDGRPAFGADVTLTSQSYSMGSCMLAQGPSHHVRTNEAGQFNLIGVNVGQVGVTVSDPFLPTSVGARGALTHDGDSVDFHLQLVDTIAGELSGTVYLPDGVTPAGAGVQVTVTGVLPDIVVDTDDQGHFRFAKILPEGTYTLTARDPRTGGLAQEAVFLRASQDAVHDLRLRARGTVRVRVVDGSDQAVPNALVTLREQSYPYESVDGAIEPANEGVIAFDRIVEGQFGVEVVDSHGRGGRVSATVPMPDANGLVSAIDVTVRLTVTGTVRGHFLRPDGATSIPFGIVTLSGTSRPNGQASTPGSGDVGSFEFNYVPAGPVRLEARDPLTGRSGVAVGSIATDGQVITLDVKAQGLGTVQGTVTSNGVPQPGAHVEVVSGTFDAGTTADSSGSYILPGVPEGRVVVTASLAFGFLAGTASQTLTGDLTMLTIDVALHDSGQLTGRVLQPDGVTPAPPSIVSVQVGGLGGSALTASTDAQGQFAFDRVPAGLATIAADVLGSVDFGVGSAEVIAGQSVQTNLTLNGAGSIAGQALDSAGQPIQAIVTIAGTGAAHYTLVVQAVADGTFHLPEVLAGPFSASVRLDQPSGVALFGTASGSVAPGAETALTVSVQDTGTIAGLVLRADHATPAIGANVTIQLDHSRGSMAVQAQADGRFSAVGVPLGGFTVSIADPQTTGVGLVPLGQLATNLQTVDVGTIVLDDTPIAVVSIDPADSAIGVAPSAPVTVVFSDPIAAITGLSVRDGDAYVPIAASLSADGTTVTLRDPFGGFPEARDLTVQVTTTLADVFGRHPSQTVTSHFRTADLSPPLVSTIAPANLATQVPVTSAITVTFSEPLSAATDLSALVSVTGPAGVVAGTAVLTSPAVAVFTPAAAFSANATYSVVVNGALDPSGNRQVAAFNASFATPDTIAPALQLSAPPTTGFVRTKRPIVQVVFSDALSGADTTTAILTIDGSVVPLAHESTFVTFNPTADLAEGTHILTATVADRVGNVGTLGASFAIDTLPPAPPVVTGVAEGQVIAGTVTLGGSTTDATSGVARIDLLRDGAPFQSLVAPSFSAAYDTNSFAEGMHTLTATATDVAGNASAAGPAVHVVVDNRPLTVAITAPASGSRFKDTATVTMTTSEAVDHVTFTAGTTTVTMTTSPFTASVSLATAPEGTATITATAYGTAGEVVTAAVAIVVDRTPPAAPDLNRLDAEPPAVGASLVSGIAGAVEAAATVFATNTVNGATAQAAAAGDGSFSLSVQASVDDVIALVAADAVGNRSGATLVAVRRTPSLPPVPSDSSLHFEGVLVDRVGGASGAITPDGNLDAVFTLNLSIGSVTRTLSFIDLAGPTLRSTRVGAGGALGVAADAGAPLLNNANGTVGVSLSGTTSVTLFASDGGFIQNGATYTATVAFTDGSRFVATWTIVPPEDRTAVAHSLRIAATPTTVTGTAQAPGSATLVLSDIRDIDGTRVPDGANIAIAVVDMASIDPRGVAIHSAGGTIVGGTPAANNANFRVFTISGGSVTATYTMLPVTPTAVTGATAVVQVEAADAAGNVLGTEAVGTIDLNLRAPTDQAIVSVSPTSLYADKSDRRSHVVIQVRDATGHPVADGTHVGVAALVDGAFASQSVLGGVGTSNGNYRGFSVAGGVVELDCSSVAIAAFVGQVRTLSVQVVLASANYTLSGGAIGTGTIALTGGGTAEIRWAADSVPLVSPARLIQANVHHVHDVRANLVPDGATFGLTVNAVQGTGVASAGGTLTGGAPAGQYQAFALNLGQINATYATDPLTVTPGSTLTTNLQVSMMDPSLSGGSDGHGLLDLKPISFKSLLVVPPGNAVGTAQPAAVLADAGLHTTTVTFTPVLDAWGNLLPDGSKVVASALGSTFTLNGVSVPSAGGQILDGTASPSGSSYKYFTVQNGAVTITYGDQNLTASPGQLLTANVTLLESTSSGAAASFTALGVVPVTLAGLTSAQATASPTALYGDGADRRSHVTLTNLRDAAGQLVPDGTTVSPTTNGCTQRDSNGNCFPTIGQILGGTVDNQGNRYFTVQNGQVVFDFSSLNATPVSSGSTTARVWVQPSKPGTGVISGVIAVVTVQLLAPGTASGAASPVDVFADSGTHQSQIVISNLLDSDGVTPLPDGARVALSVANNAASNPDGSCCVTSVGGQILSAGTTTGDGTFVFGSNGFYAFTIAGGQVRAVYSDVNLYAQVNQTTIARVSVVPLGNNGGIFSSRALGVATINLHGTSSATASGPATLPRIGGTGSVTFSGIKDSAGNAVPDGTVVLVTPFGNLLTDPTTGSYVQSVGGTIVDGTPSGNYKAFTVTNGSITVTYSTTGAGTGVARVQITSARPDRVQLDSKTLQGGVWAITVQ